MTDDELAAAAVWVTVFEQRARADYAAAGEDQAEADQAMVTARQAGCLRSVLERRIVQRATRASLRKQRIA